MHVESSARPAQNDPAALEHLPVHVWRSRARHSGVLVDRRYRLISPLGAGGMGTVWRAFDEKLGRQVAIKFTPQAEHEARILNRRDTLGVVSAFASGSYIGEPFLVMRMVRGRGLQAVLDHLREIHRTTLQRPRQAADLLAAIGTGVAPGRPALVSDHDWFETVALVIGEVLRALDAVHASGIVHHDLKPANLMLEGGGHPVILDLGLAEPIDKRPEKGERRLPGTVTFMAPEDLRRGYTVADPRGDIYQVGLVLYEMLTLQRCFAPRSVGEDIVQRIVQGEFVAPQRIDGSVPSGLATVCLRAMRVDPRQRFQTAAEFRRALLTEIGQVPADQQGWLFRLLRRQQRR